MHEVNELLQLAVPIASVGGVAAMLSIAVARDARRQRRSLETSSPLDAPRALRSLEPLQPAPIEVASRDVIRR